MSLRDGYQNDSNVETGNITLEVTGELRKQLEQARASRSPITLTLDNMVVISWRTQGSSFLRDMRDIVTLKQVKMIGKKEDANVNTRKTGEAFVDHCANEIVALINQIRIVGESHTATLTRVGVTDDKDPMLYNTETSENVSDLQKKAYLRILKDSSSTLDDIDRAATLLRIMEKNANAKTTKEAALLSESVMHRITSRLCTLRRGIRYSPSTDDVNNLSDAIYKLETDLMAGTV